MWKKLPYGKFRVTLSSGESDVYDRCIISTGGKSYPSTGSEGDGYKIAKKLGHEVSDIRPGLVGIKSNDMCCKNMQGLTLKNVRITVYDLEKQIYQAFGEMMFAHFGITGPIVLSASSKISRIDGLNEKIKEGKITFSIDLKPALTYEALDKRLCRDFLKYSTKEFKNSLKDLLPSKMINEVIIKSGIPKDKKVSGITKEERERLGYVIKNFKVSVSGLMPIETGIITVGGVKLNQVNPKTLESKLMKNLYFIGEILDLDAYTGGFNLQIAFSTGYACGHYISESE